MGGFSWRHFLYLLGLCAAAVSSCANAALRSSRASQQVTFIILPLAEVVSHYEIAKKEKKCTPRRRSRSQQQENWNFWLSLCPGSGSASGLEGALPRNNRPRITRWNARVGEGGGCFVRAGNTWCVTETREIPHIHVFPGDAPHRYQPFCGRVRGGYLLYLVSAFITC